MRRLLATLALAVFGCGFAAADEVPLPRPRPDISVEPLTFTAANPGLFDTSELTSEPSDCRLRLQAMAEVEPLPRLIGPGQCGGADMVRVDAVFGANHTRIALNPAPMLRCPMAESLVAWVRDEAAPRAAERLGASLRSVITYDDYECRGRNRVTGAKLSEHGKGDAVDIRALELSNGRSIQLVDIHADKDFRAALRQSACARFRTVLGPGSDSHHESHIHLDNEERRNGYRICQWDVREPPSGEVASNVPLPQPRPAIPAQKP